MSHLTLERSFSSILHLQCLPFSPNWRALSVTIFILFSLPLTSKFLSLLIRKHTCLKHVILSRPHGDVLTDWSFCTKSTSPILRGGKRRCCCIIGSISCSWMNTRKPWETSTPLPLGDLARQGRGLSKSPSSLGGRPEKSRTRSPDSCPLSHHYFALNSPPHLFCSISAYEFPI